MKRLLPKLFSWLVAVLIIFIPSNLFLVLNESAGFVNGLRIDYLIPKWYFTDILILFIILIGFQINDKRILSIKNHFFASNKNRGLIIFFSLLVIAQFFSAKAFISFFTLIKMIEYGLLTVVLTVNKKYLSLKTIQLSLMLAIIIQLIFALYQFKYQHSLTPYKFSGESEINQSTIGLARGTFNGEERLLAYGTTPHPNVLAGIVALFTVLLLIPIGSKNWVKYILLLIPAGLIISLTQSWSAALALLCGLLLLHKYRLLQNLINSNKRRVAALITLSVFIFPILLMLLSSISTSPSLSRRNDLNDAAFAMFQAKPLTGIGVGNFTAVLEHYSQSRELVRFIQPVHNNAWLYLAETGILGIVILILLIKLTMKATWSPLVFALIPLVVLDHYLVTTQSGILTALLFVLLAHSLTENFKIDSNTK